MKSFTLIPLATTILLAGCVSPASVDYDRAATAKLGSYQCYEIDSRESRTSHQNVALSPIVDRRIEQAITNALNAKGLSQDCGKTDFRVTFNTITRSRTEVTDLSTGPTPFRRYPYFGYSSYSHIDVDQYEEGTFIIDIIDVESNELVWRGTYTKRLGWSAPSDEEVRKIVKEILEQFPPNAKQ
jgi:hypothetical protein